MEGLLKILVVEDIPQQRKRIVDLLTKTLSGYEVGSADNRDSALAALTCDRPDVVILDLLIPSAVGAKDEHLAHGEAVLTAAKRTVPHCKVIIVSIEGELARDFLIEKGADDFFLKSRREDWEQEKLPRQLEQMVGHLVCRSEAMQSLRAQAAAVEPDAALVTIEGAPGSGKEYLASVLHRCSPRGLRPFRALDVSGLSHDNLLVEIVGKHGENARRGLLDEGLGCLYLSGIERTPQLPADTQAQLAEVLRHTEDGRVRYRPVEASTWREADTRLVLASSVPVAKLTMSDELIPELAAVLAAAPRLALPPPSERLDDVRELLHSFRRTSSQRLGRSVRRLDRAVPAMIQAWLRSEPPATGWDAVAQVVENAIRTAPDDTLLPEHLALPDLPERYAFVWSRAGQVRRARGSEVDLARLDAQEWSLLMHARHDGHAPAVRRVIREETEVPLDDPRLGRLLHLLAAKAGQPVELSRLKPALGIDRGMQMKRFIMLLRQALGDTEVQNRTSRFLESHYSETYAFRTEEDFLLVAELAESRPS